MAKHRPKPYPSLFLLCAVFLAVLGAELVQAEMRFDPPQSLPASEISRLIQHPCFWEIKPHSGSLKDGRHDLVYHQNPGFNIGDPFPLWTLH